MRGQWWNYRTNWEQQFGGVSDQEGWPDPLIIHSFFSGSDSVVHSMARQKILTENGLNADSEASHPSPTHGRAPFLEHLEPNDLCDVTLILGRLLWVGSYLAGHANIYSFKHTALKHEVLQLSLHIVCNKLTTFSFWSPGCLIGVQKIIGRNIKWLRVSLVKGVLKSDGSLWKVDFVWSQCSSGRISCV